MGQPSDRQDTSVGRAVAATPAETTLILVTRVLAERRLDAVLIGNAAAAIQGSPVTTMDFDFMFRKTPTTWRS